MMGIMEKFFFPPFPSYFYIGTRNQGKGTGSVPFFISVQMDRQAQARAISDLTEAMLAEDPSCFLVGVSVKPVDNVKVFIDSDTGLGIDRCVRYNRSLYRRIVEAGIYPDGTFSLEVSSPGVDEPLKLRRQYMKNAGRRVEVTLVDGTPVLDIKPYVPYADAFPGARGGWVDETIPSLEAERSDPTGWREP